MHPQRAIRTPRIISHFLYFFQLTLPCSTMTAALPAESPFSSHHVSQGMRHLLVSLNWEASFDSSFPPCLTLEQVLVHPTQTFPEAILLLTVQVKVGHQHPPNLVYCHVLPLNGLRAPGQHTSESLFFPPVANLPSQPAALKPILYPIPLYSKILPKCINIYL